MFQISFIGFVSAVPAAALRDTKINGKIEKNKIGKNQKDEKQIH